MKVKVTLQPEMATTPDGKLEVDGKEEVYTADVVRVLDGGALLLFRVDPKSNMAEILKAFAAGTWVSAERIEFDADGNIKEAA